MIKTEIITVNGRQLVRTYSDTGRKIQRDGVIYDEAIDPIDSGRTYTEASEGAGTTEISAEEALDIIIGGI